MAKSLRIKKRFTKPLPAKKFQKQIVRRIHLDRDRTFTESAFEELPQGRVSAPPGSEP